MQPLPFVLAAALLTCQLTAQPRDPAREAQRARELVAAGRLDEAIRIYRDLLQASPDNPALLLNLCVTEYSAKQYESSISHASAALKLKPDLLPAHLFLGASRLELGEFAQAIESLELVVAANPSERNGRLMLGEALLGIGRSDGAVPHLRAAAEMLPANPRVWYALGRALENSGQAAAAQGAWERLRTLPPSLESHSHAADLLTAGQRWREAAAQWRAALQAAPENRPARVGLGWALFRIRDYEAAMTELKPLLDSGRADVQFLYGASLLNLQQPVAAMPYLRSAIARDAGFVPARAALGQSLLQTGQTEAAIPLLEAAVSTDTDGSIHYQLFRAYQLAHRRAEAQQALAGYHRLRTSLAAAP